MQWFLSYFFQINHPDPVRSVFVALAVLNAILMLTVAVRSFPSWLSVYLPCAALASLLLATPLWGQAGEILLILAAAGWAMSLIPRDSKGIVFTVALAILFTAAVHLAAPPPWPRYPEAQYYTRLYSTAVFFACAWGSFLVALFDRKPTPWESVVAIPWFGAVLLALVNRGWQYFSVGITAKSIWTGCLIAWLVLNLRREASGRSLPRGASPSKTPGTLSFVPRGTGRAISTKEPWPRPR